MPTAVKSAKQLREERAPLAKEIRRLADLVNGENRDFTAEEKAAWEKVNDDYNALTRQIEFSERAETVEGEQRARRDERRQLLDDTESRNGNGRRPGHDGGEEISEETRALAFAAWCRTQLGEDATEEQQAACDRLHFNPQSRRLIMPLSSTDTAKRLRDEWQRGHPSTATQRLRQANLERRDMSAIAGPAGGYLVPPETLIRELEINLLYYGGIRQTADVIRTTSGERMSWPTADDTTNTGLQLEENTSIGSTVSPTLGKVYWDAYKFSSQPVLVPFELLEDSAFQLAAILGELLGIRLGRITNTKFTTGSGANTPKGLVTAATLGVTTASSTAIAADELIGLIHSIDPAYRTQGCGWMMHDKILLAIRKLKDGMGQYLWQSGLQMGVPDRLLSYPLTINQDMDSTLLTTKKTVLFDLLSKYKIRTVNQVRLYRLQERYRDIDQDGFIAFLREDGNLLDAGTHPVKYLQQV